MPSKVAHSVAEHFDKQVEHGRIEAFLNAQLFCQVTATQFAAGVLINIIELAFQFGQFRLERFDCQSVFEGEADLYNRFVHNVFLFLNSVANPYIEDITGINMNRCDVYAVIG